MSENISRGDLKKAIDDARAELNDLEQLVDDLPNSYGKMRGADIDFDKGDVFESVVADDGSGTKHGDPMVRTDGVVTFLNTADGIDVQAGDSVKYVITDIDARHASGVVTGVLDG